MAGQMSDAGDRGTPADSAALTGYEHGAARMPALAFVESDLMSALVGAKKFEYYRKKFQTIIEKSGLQNTPLSDITWRDLEANRNRRAVGIKPFLPFTARSLYNWPAFFFNFFWGVWRGVYLKWYLFAAFLVLNVVDTLVEARTGFSFLLKGGSIGIAVSAALYGNSLLLYALIKEARSGNIRKNPTSQKDLWIAILIALVVAVIEIAFID